ncbi:DUF692 domain-containing protein [Phenylobacterium sp.]|uniref:MNIO family bufferin maturase n=1 Tax=Phenylobacterium sp. TaxID=1871053 RepID=UPI00393DD79A
MRSHPHAGLGLKPQHYAEALSAPSDGLWFEVHAENHMAAGGPRLAWLDAIARDKPISLHGVGLSLAADEPPDEAHLDAFRRLVDRYDPMLVSEHLAWSRRRGVHAPDLLPFPRSRPALDRICANVGRMQDALRRRVLIENPSLYLALAGHEFGEVEFLAELCRRAGCGLLLDVNNVFVSAANLGFSAEAYVDAVPGEAVGEIHLAGHQADARLGGALLIDTHGAPVAEPVWMLYARLIRRIGPRPTLIERDDAVPAFADLMAERGRAERLLAACWEPAHA